MIRAQYSRLFNLSRSTLFDYLRNPLNDRHWQSSCAQVELLDGSIEPGSRYAIVFSFLGRRMNFECQITALEPPARYAFKVLQGPFLYEGEYGLEAVPEGTRLSWQFDVEPGRFFGILPVSLLKKVLISQVEKDLSRLATLLQDDAALSKEWIHE